MRREPEWQTLVLSFVEMIALGLNPLQALRRLEPLPTRFRGELRALQAALEQGRPLPRETRLLPAELPALLELGGRGVELAPAMEGAARYLAAVHGLLRTARAPLFYPLLLFAMLGQLSHLLRDKVLPVFKAELPLLDLFGSGWLTAALAALALLLGYWIWWRRAPTARPNPTTRLVESLLAWIPGLRTLVTDPALATAASSLAVTLRAGVAGADALRLAGESSRSASLRSALEIAARSVAGGRPLGEAAERGKLPPELRVALAAEGEERWLALEAVARTALDRLELRARRVSVLSFSIALLLAAVCIGAVLVGAYQAIGELPGKVG